jgi:hypothetical protein
MPATWAAKTRKPLGDCVAKSHAPIVRRDCSLGVFYGWFVKLDQDNKPTSSMEFPLSTGEGKQLHFILFKDKHELQENRPRCGHGFFFCCSR